MVANRLTGHVAALNMMNIMQNRAVSIRIRPETPYVSHAYHLILDKWNWGSKANKVLKILENSKNKQLFHYSIGVGRLYNGRHTKARRRFAKGIFLAADLSERDFERAGIEWDPDLDKEGNAYRIAEEFIAADPRGKERYLAMVEKRFEKVKVDPKAQLKVEVNLKTGKFGKIPDSYRMESVFWNLGGYLVSEDYLSNWENVKPIYDTGLYDKFCGLFKYGTANNTLWGDD